MQPSEGAQSGSALGGQHIGGAIADLVPFVGGHLAQQPVQGAVGITPLAVTAIVIERDLTFAAGIGRPAAGGAVAVRIGQGQGIPDRRLDRILQVLVGGVPGFVARRQFELGEEVAAERPAAQVSDIPLLGVELRLLLGRRRRPRTGVGISMVRQLVEEPSAPEVSADEQDHNERQDQDQAYDQGRGTVVMAAAAAVATAAVAAALPGLDRVQQLGFRRRRNR